MTRSKEDARAKAEEVLKRIQEGGDFAALAKQFGDCPSGANGGDLGEFGEGQMSPPFERAVVGLPLGGMSGIVETSFGFHIIHRTQ